MKRGTLFTRIVIVNATIMTAAAGIGALTINAALTPQPSISHEQFKADSLAVCRILDHTPSYNPYLERLDSMPPGGIRLKVDRGMAIRREFNDSNYLHIAEATSLGIEPINETVDVWKIERPVIKVESCQDFYVDNLTHSLPYLVPEAEQLLHDIGQAFRDSLTSRGGGEYRVKVTSILRTHSSIRRLRRRNGNAVGGSAHLYGTTFDLSYSNFVCDSLTIPRTTEDLRLLLAEILRDFRQQGRCYVKHERKQSCFHITTRRHS